MGYSVHLADSFDTFTKGVGFAITKTGEISGEVSITYIALQDSRDPEDAGLVTKINPGYSALYLVLDGTVSFTFYDGQEDLSVSLGQREYVQVTPGTRYDFEGSGIVALIAQPAYTGEMFSHPSGDEG